MQQDWKLHRVGDLELYTDHIGMVREVLREGKFVDSFDGKLLRTIRKVEEDEKKLRSPYVH